MKISNYDEQEVEITAVYFRPGNQKQKLETYPKRMVINGQEFNFLESGMRYLIRKGQDLPGLGSVATVGGATSRVADGARPATTSATRLPPWARSCMMTPTRLPAP